jgi:hypothetical protein
MPKQDPADKAEQRRGASHDYDQQPNDQHTPAANLGQPHQGDRSKRSPVEPDADSSRGDPPHGYGTEAPQVQGGGKR